MAETAAKNHQGDGEQAVVAVALVSAALVRKGVQQLVVYMVEDQAALVPAAVAPALCCADNCRLAAVHSDCTYSSPACGGGPQKCGSHACHACCPHGLLQLLDPPAADVWTECFEKQLLIAVDPAALGQAC